MFRSTSKLSKCGFSILRPAVTLNENIFRYQHNTVQTDDGSKRNKFLQFSQTEGYTKLSNYGSITETDQLLDQFVWENISKWQDHTATICTATERSYKFAKMRDKSASLAIRLQKILKLQPRDVMAVCLPNVPEYPIAILGGIQAGLVITLVNPAYTPDEIARQLKSSDTKLIICLIEQHECLAKAAELCNRKIPIICIRQSTSIPLPNNAIDFFEITDTNGIQYGDLQPTGITADDVVFLPYSSGTTGLPKAVQLTHRNITSNCKQFESKFPDDVFVKETTADFQESIPCMLPFFHIYGLTICMLSKIHLGCKLVTIQKFTPQDLIKSLTKHEGTILNLVPPVLLLLTQSAAFKAEQIKKLNMVMSGAAPVGALDIERFNAKFPNVSFNQGYGLTECSPCTIVTPIGNKNYASCGFNVASTEARIIAIDDAQAVGLGPNQTGELCVRGPQLMKGYLNNDEANKNAFYQGKWFRTGDLAYYDDDGYFYLTDRLKELIKVKGFQVPPAELEELLRDHPKIIDAAVFAVDDKMSGEIPRAVVVLQSGQTATEEEIQKYIAEKVIHYKHLKGGVVFLNEIPKNAAGKILRKDLKLKFSK